MMDTTPATPATPPGTPRSARTYVTGPGEGKASWFANALSVTKADAAHTGGSYAVVEQLVDKHGEPPPHIHHREDEAFYVLEGQVTVHVGEDDYPAPAGSFAFCPRGIRHGFTVDSDRARLLIVLSPPGFEALFAAAGQPARSAALPEPTAPDVPRLVSAAAGYGCEILPPDARPDAGGSPGDAD